MQRQRHRFDRPSRIVAHSVLNGLHHEYRLLPRAAWVSSRTRWTASIISLSAGSTMARASSGSRSRIISVEPLISANSAVTVLRSPSRASRISSDPPSAPRYLLRDRDASYGSDFRSRVEAMGITEVVTAPHSPWQNAYVERVIGSIRRDCLDHIVIFNQRHLRCVLSSYVDY
jgi:transposase InsO family protein